MRSILSSFLPRRSALALLAAVFAAPVLAATPVQGFKVVNSYPHDPDAFTQGLFFHDGFLFEGTGLRGRSSIRKVEIESGKVVQQVDLPADVFGEGISQWGDRLIGITWTEQTAAAPWGPRTPRSVVFHDALWIFSGKHTGARDNWGGDVWRQVAFYTMAGGIITALIAAVPGFIDLLSINQPKLKRIGIFHMIINLVVVGLYVINLLLRRGGLTEEPTPIILSGIGVVLFGISGWLGGELVHRYRVSVDEPGQEGDQIRPA